MLQVNHENSGHEDKFHVKSVIEKELNIKFHWIKNYVSHVYLKKHIVYHLLQEQRQRGQVIHRFLISKLKNHLIYYKLY